MTSSGSNDPPEVVFEVHYAPIHDTGIGQEMGYEDDKAFLAAMRAERDAMPADARALVDDLDRRIQREMLGLPEKDEGL